MFLEVFNFNSYNLNINIFIEYLNITCFLIIGGASKEETDSGLFIYSKIPFVNIKTKNRNINFDDNNKNNDENNNDNYEKVVMKESWNFNEKNFEWKNNEDLLSNPRIISQVSV